MCELMFRTWLLAFVAGFLLSGVRPVCGIDIYTSRELEAVNGTNVKLKCTFNSVNPVSQSVSVSWTFRPLSGGADESVFYYQGGPFPPPEGRFKGQVEWSGDVLKKDVSITLQRVPPTFNGTYICQVRNPPDVHGVNGEIYLKIVNKVTLSEIGLLTAAIGGACVVILVLLGIIVAVRLCRKKSEHGIEMHPKEFEKGDPTVW
ncbi:myelin protein zero-like protein 2b [Nothobranchius furzeri]|uniref:Myelin protein zero like 2 n=2 Tax=Nothobranchius furzeri TaxID=105023 RepID=A0A9D2XPN3_NOTFU|nr:myelin protein zero-like protein 2b [Nothobranchius furzeri]KAF7205950.1 myelin protein zero like 2 [Nothobranchius furzeri]